MRPFLTVTNAGTGEVVIRFWEYEDAILPLSITEQITAEAARITERFVYAGNQDEAKTTQMRQKNCLTGLPVLGLP